MLAQSTCCHILDIPALFIGVADSERTLGFERIRKVVVLTADYICSTWDGDLSTWTKTLNYIFVRDSC